MIEKRTILTATGLLAALLLLAGCARDEQVTEEKSDIAVVKAALARTQKIHDPKVRINYFRTAYLKAGELESKWPDSERAAAFLEKYETDLNRIPEQVLKLSKISRDLDSYKWAVANSARVELHYDALKDIWKMGRQWRDYYVAEYPEQALPIFMSESANEENVSFYNQYIDAFRASGYQLVHPLEQNEFNARFSHFIALMIQTALEKQDLPRIEALLTDMPLRNAGEYVGAKTAAIMKLLSNYVFHELKDEALACRLVDLGYDTVRVDIDKSGFGNVFARKLVASPEAAVTNILKLNEWHGALTEKETRFILILPEPPLRLVHKLYLTEAIVAAMKKRDTKKAGQLIKVRESLDPMSIREYDQLLTWSLKYGNTTVYNHVKTKCTQIDTYRIDLPELGQSEYLFKQHAPKIFKKIYPTMDKSPRPDGTTIGRIYQLLTSHSPEAVLYLISNYNFTDEWLEADVKKTQLMAVCEGGNFEAARYLIENRRADVHAETFYSESSVTLLGNARTEEGRLTPLFFAAKSGNSELIEYLVLKRGARVNARSNYGVTPLMYATRNNKPQSVSTLIKLGADVNASISLHGSIRVADLSAQGLHPGDTAYTMARKSGNTEIQDILRKAGARTN